LNKYLPDSECFNFYYKYAEGRLFWKVSPSMNKSIGDPACNNDSNGYRRSILGNNQYRSHRVIFCMHHGYMPKYIDHINRNGQDNRIENLRDATSSLNNHNKTIRKDSTSGVKGVSWNKAVNKWHARLTNNGSMVFSKYFNNINDAEAELCKQRKIYKINY
jgi:hypothetical protein